MDTALLIGGVLTITAILSTRLSRRFGVPTLVVFVMIGLLVGEAGLGLRFDDYALSYDVGLVALATILLSGGLDTDAALFRASVVPGGLLATVGVVIKMLLVAGLALWITPLDLTTALLLGAVLAPTDAAAVFSVLQGRGLPERIQGVLETESGTNDPVSIYLTLALTTLATGGAANGWTLAIGVVVQLALGGVLGWAAGRLIAWVVDEVAVDARGLYPILVLAGGMATYGGANLLGGNGFLAIYLMGLVVGNRRVAHATHIGQFMDGAAWLAQIVMFVLLGLLASPARLATHLPMALCITLALTVLARPASVLLVLGPLGRRWPAYRFDAREQALVAWAGLKGAVPIILAIVPLLHGVEGGELLFDIVFVVVIAGTTLQGLTIIPLASALGLLERPPEPPPDLTGSPDPEPS